ncbi:MAG: hypothetical protein GXY83_31075 [Rhodopirellula sp.]|nr:hypothetical protein [Rhodopirellula sp.]
MFRPIHRERLAITKGQRVRITIDDQSDPEAVVVKRAQQNGDWHPARTRILRTFRIPGSNSPGFARASQCDLMIAVT